MIGPPLEITVSLHTYCLLPVHALVEVLKLNLALRLGTGLPNAMGTFDPLLLKGMAACRPLVGLLATLHQQPAIHVDAEPRLQIHERHDANGRGVGGDSGEAHMMDNIRCSGPEQG